MSEEWAEGLRRRLRGELLLPTGSSAAFKQACRSWNLDLDKRPHTIIKCRGTSDVVHAVNFARQLKLPLTVAGGRMSGACQRDGAVCIDLSLMRGVMIEPERRIARVQGGALAADLVAEGALYGLQTPVAMYMQTGLAALATTGGVGFLSSLYGLTLDNVLSIELVTAKGKVVRCSATQEPELFWGMRGAGPNFGVVTALELQLHPVNMVYGGIALFPDVPGRTRKLLELQREIVESRRGSRSMLVVILTGGGAGTQEGNAPSVVFGNFAVSEEDGYKALAELRAVGPSADALMPQPYSTVNNLSDHIEPSAHTYTQWLMLKSMPDAVIDILINLHIGRPSRTCLVIVFPLGEATSHVSHEATSFAHRKARYSVLLLGSILDEDFSPALFAKATKWVKDGAEALTSFAIGAMPTPCGREDENANQMELMRFNFGDHLPRLRALKSKWDPENVFWSNCNIKPL